MGRIRNETLSGTKWQLASKITLEPVQLVYGMILARFVGPEEMGILGLTAIFFAVARTLAEAGFGQALIRKLDRTDADINTMFWFNVGMSLLMSGTLFLAAPWFAEFYHQPALRDLTRVSAVMMFLNSTGSIHWTLYTCRRDFKTPAIIRVVTTLIGIPICLVLAWKGFSYWSVVIQGVVVSLVSLVTIWIVSPWKPRFMFSGKSFRELFGFGSKLAASNLLGTIYFYIKPFIVGKFYSAADLGLYSRGCHLARVAPQTFSSIVDQIAYPILATIQNDDTRLRSVYQKYIKISTLVICWGTFLIAAMGEPLVRVLYGEKWLGCVVFLQIVCFSVCLTHISSINLGLLKVKGRSDLVLWLEVIKKTVSLAMAIYAATISVEAICWAGVIYCQIAIFLNSYYTAKLIDLSWWQQQKDYFPYVMASFVTVTPAYFISMTPLHPILQLACGGLSALLLYYAYLHFKRDDAYRELLICAAQSPKIKRVKLLEKFIAYEMGCFPAP